MSLVDLFLDPSLPSPIETRLTRHGPVDVGSVEDGARPFSNSETDLVGGATLAMHRAPKWPQQRVPPTIDVSAPIRRYLETKHT